MGNYAFKRIKESVDNYVNRGFCAKKGNKTVKMIPVKIFLQDIVSGKFKNAEEAKEMYLDNVYGDEKNKNVR